MTNGPHVPPSAPHADAGHGPADAVVSARGPLGGGEVLDAQALDRLRELDPGGRNNLVQRVLDAFVASAGKLVPQLGQARKENDLKGIRHVAHTLKSSSASIGAVRLTPLCAEVEAMVREARCEGIEGRLDALETEIDNVLDAIRAQRETNT
jgi:HPt (histidine-containing phosphotransfer) domain-containing protein